MSVGIAGKYVVKRCSSLRCKSKEDVKLGHGFSMADFNHNLATTSGKQILSRGSLLTNYFCVEFNIINKIFIITGRM